MEKPSHMISGAEQQHKADPEAPSKQLLMPAVIGVGTVTCMIVIFVTVHALMGEWFFDHFQGGLAFLLTIFTLLAYTF